MGLVMQTDAPFWDSLVFDGIDDVDVEAVTAAFGTVEVVARGRAAGSGCPDCGRFSDRVHDRYQRRLEDLPLADQGLVIRLTVRRFICGSAACSRRTFAESFSRLAAPPARFTRRLNHALERVGLALAGRAGARLAAHLGFGAVERLNEDWYDLAVSSGLLNHRREFLVLLPHCTHTHQAVLHEQNQHYGRRAAPAAWTRVRLLDRWDIMDRGAASAFLGIRAGHPGFGMMALDSSVYISCSTGEIGVDVSAVAHPARSENILQYREWYAHWDYPLADKELQKRIAVWLAGRAPGTVSRSDR